MNETVHRGRIGPNAIIRIAESLEASQGRQAVTDLFHLAGLDRYLQAMPTEMVDEQEVVALQGALRVQLGIPAARSVSRDAGLRTGDYLLANRIPRPAQRLLSILPPSLACRTLIKAIRGNSWTFVGTGVFDADPSYPPKLLIANSPMCRGATAAEPLCDFYAGTFERLFRRLVQRESVVTEIACEANGAPRCVFEVRW
ncbi:bacteriochlorophyll 4-vinyl reductase [Thiocystis violascens]|uniref:bacteriochlorophyll 4-vinyl reductase n=1 Tax=Thiocystis violascens TaxID=73141 RepID=UPI00059C9A9A|nr:bacteriochlorophyll 4-vinyl reductase [Thiocystis violascens]